MRMRKQLMASCASGYTRRYNGRISPLCKLSTLPAPELAQGRGRGSKKHAHAHSKRMRMRTAKACACAQGQGRGRGSVARAYRRALRAAVRARLRELPRRAGAAAARRAVLVPLSTLLYGEGTRVLISLSDSLMFGRVPGTRPNISESHSELSTRVPFCIVL